MRIGSRWVHYAAIIILVLMNDDFDDSLVYLVTTMCVVIATITMVTISITPLPMQQHSN